MTTPSEKPLITLFACGPAKCDHQWDRYEPIKQDDIVVGETAVCSKCGHTAFDEAQWS